MSALRPVVAPLENAVNGFLAGQVSVRAGWAAVAWALQRDPGSPRPAPWGRLDLRTAPSYPAADPTLLSSLRTAAVRALTTAPVIEPEDVGSSGLLLGDVPELIALSLVEDLSELDGVDATRWAGLAVALMTVPVEPDESDLRRRLLAICASRAEGQLMRTVREVMARLAGGWRVEARQMLAPLMHSSSRSSCRPARPAAAELRSDPRRARPSIAAGA